MAQRSLGYRAEQLAKTCAKPILVLCYNKTVSGGGDPGGELLNPAAPGH